MKLIKVETQGFKSFADKTTLTFDGGIVGIVGPNGSGKSNINDAIKWVLGEQSIKSLRGDSTDDIIFSGSKTVPAMNKAEVTLTFDNSEGRISIPHKKFTISRVVERGVSGNKYYINGQPARLKEIKEVAMESGIGKSSLAIISQGTISDIAEATPEQRRGIFEEAAGISKYKTRKKEALRKLERTSEALDKVKTVVYELEKQLAPLKRQSDKAKIYLSKKDELRDVELGLIAEDAKFFSSKLNELKTELDEVLSTKEDLNNRINVSDNELEEKTSHKLSLENQVHMLNEKFQDVSDKLRTVELSSSQASQRRQMVIDGQIKNSSADRLTVMKEELQELSNKVSKYSLWEEKSTSDVAHKRETVSETQRIISSSNLEIERAKRELLQSKTRISIFKDHRDNKSNLFKGTKTILENKSLFPGFEGIVSDLIQVDEKYQVAIETILANALQHVVVNSSSDAVKAVNFLKSNRGGRATFIPLDVIRPKGINESFSSILNSQNGFIDIASDLISARPKYEILFKFLLGNVVVAETIEDANNISKLLRSSVMVVSLSGDIVRPGGVISGGEKSKSRDLLGVDKKIELLESKIPTLERFISTKSIETNQLSNSISEDQALIAELNIETAKVREKKNIVERQFRNLKSQFESESDQKLDLVENILDSEDFLESEKSSIKAQLTSKRESIISINKELSILTITKTELEKSLRKIIENSSEKMTLKNQAEFILNSHKERISSEYEMTLELAMSEHSLTMDREEAREIVSELRSAIKQLGFVNVESIEAYEEVRTRHEKIKSSEEELLTAQETIISAIGEMDKIIISRLDETVQGVNKEMDSIFKTMFGGGMAEVKYTDPSNLLETGIVVIAQPPGKTVKNLKLFSGGEKAIVAITLLFAILKSKPLPLCILDEVEAALDDANVIRYANYLQELKHQTQFIVVTHRSGTMARVDHLFGATMQTRGVTTFFSARLADAKKLIGQ
ncbi:MAG: AAA family ATPase [Mycoplasmataceae bacterium]|nr:AAA family ATPase [Mycoplasmataceae bacterium]